MKFLKRFELFSFSEDELINSTLDITDLNFVEVENERTTDKIVFERMVLYPKAHRYYYNEFPSVQEYLENQAAAEGRWTLYIKDLYINGTYESTLFNKRYEVDKDYPLQEKLRELLELSIDSGVKIINYNKCESIDIDIKSTPHGYGENFKVNERIVFKIKKPSN